MDSELAALLPGREVSVNGVKIHVTPLFFGQYPKGIKLVRPLASVIQMSGAFKIKPTTSEAGEVSLNLQVTDNWLAALPMILEEGGEALLAFFAFCLGKPREWFNTVPADEGFELAGAILKENQDFFVQKVLPKLADLGWTKTVLTDTVGDTSSPNSSASDIPGQISS